MHIRAHLSSLLAAALLVGGSACASSPDVPEEQSKESPNYKSTQPPSETQESTEENEEGAASKSSSTSTGANAGKAAGSKEIPKATGPVAHVDGEPIPAETFNKEMQKVAKTGKFPTSLLQKFKSRLIDRLVDQKLVDKAIEAASIEVAEKEVDEKLEEVRSEFDKASKKSGGKAPSLEQAAQKYGISDAELRDSIRRAIAIEKLMVEQGMELPDEEAVREFYEKNKPKFEQPEQVRTRHILAKVSPDSGEEKWKKAKKRIEKVRKKAASDGTSFSELAKKKSDGPSAKSGGDIGFIGKKGFDENFTKAAFELEKGEISKPVRTKYGWHIIKLVERREPRTVPFDEIRDRLRKRLKNRRIKKRLQSHIDELRRGAKIEKHPDNIE